MVVEEVAMAVFPIFSVFLQLSQLCPSVWASCWDYLPSQFKDGYQQGSCDSLCHLLPKGERSSWIISQESQNCKNEIIDIIDSFSFEIANGWTILLTLN